MASNVAVFSLILLSASVFILTKADDVELDALGMGVDYFSGGGIRYGKNNDRVIPEFGGEIDDSFERPDGLTNVAAGSFGRHNQDSPFKTIEARRSGRVGGRNHTRRKELAERKKQKQEEKRKEKERRKQEWEKKRIEKNKEENRQIGTEDDGSE